MTTPLCARVWLASSTVSPIARRVNWIQDFVQDLRYGFRALRKSPGFTAIAVLTLALGIGANAAVFSVLYRDLLRPLPYRSDDHLVFFGALIPSFDSRPFLFTSSYLQLNEGNTPFESIASWRPGINGCDLTEEHPTRLACARAESTFLPTFGIRPIRGTNFSPEEDGPNPPQVCLISYALWIGRFGSSAAALGQTPSLDGQPTRVIGVLPSCLQGHSAFLGASCRPGGRSSHSADAPIPLGDVERR